MPVGLSRRGWASDGPAREIFRRAFAAAGLPYYNPHSFRSMLVRHAMSLDLTPEEMKAWSQNLGHANVATTFTSYGAVPLHRQGALIRNVAMARTAAPDMKPEEIAALQALLTRAQGGTAVAYGADTHRIRRFGSLLAAPDQRRSAIRRRAIRSRAECR